MEGYGGWWVFGFGFGFGLLLCVTVSGEGEVVSPWKMIHRFSEEGARVIHGHGWEWPRKGTEEYYLTLVLNDHLRTSSLSANPTFDYLSFSQGNSTFDFGQSFGWLHYTWVDIGTPNVSFLVALDTGSDLFWVPCDCIRCAPTSAATYGLDKDLSVYSPAASSTSKHVTCGSSLCELPHHCGTNTQRCPYIVQYQSNNTSTSGSLVEDMLYLASENEPASGHSVKTRIVVGCGRMQTGGFLNGGAPNGLLGLGLSDVSVPSMLAKSGLVKNSFSMCFQSDDSGRIFFGDKGEPDQQTTPFLSLHGKWPTYIVGVEDIQVGSVNLSVPSFKTVFDSGTSFTYIPQDAYKAVTMEFNKQVNFPRAHYKDLPWSYCYDASSSKNVDFPDVSFIFKGGSNFSVFNPIIGLYTDNGTIEAFCLAVEEGSVDSMGIIGQNFMLGYRLVFDRENLKLGWSPSDCYKLEENEDSTSPAPSPVKGLNSEKPLQQRPSPTRAVAPAMAGHTPPMDKSFGFIMRGNTFFNIVLSFYAMISLVNELPHYTF